MLQNKIISNKEPMEGISSFYVKVKKAIREIYENTISHFIRSLFTKPVSILFLGIDNAGKTTLLNKLKNETISTFAPTHHSNKAEVEIGKMKVVIVDLGGHEVARMAWKDYFFGCNGIVFIVDVSDIERYEDVRQAFEMVRNIDAPPNGLKPPVSVLFNKIDKMGYDCSEKAEADPHFAASLANGTGIVEQGLENDQAIKVSYVSILNENPANVEGPLPRAFQWLEKMISYKTPEVK